MKNPTVLMCEKNVRDCCSEKMAILETQLDQSNSEVKRLRSDNLALTRKLSGVLRASAQKDEERISDAVRMRQSVELLEAATCERDQALSKSVRLEAENENLKLAINNLIDEAARQTKLEVDSVNEKCTEKIAGLLGEIKRLNAKICRQEAEMERMDREKVSLETALERHYADQSHKEAEQVHESGGTDKLESLKCLKALELERDRLLIQLNTANGRLKRIRASHEQDSVMLQSERDAVKTRLRHAEDELTKINDDRIQLSNKMDGLSDDLRKVVQEKGLMERNNKKQVALLQRDLEESQQKFEIQLKSASDAHKERILQMNEYMNEQDQSMKKLKLELEGSEKKLICENAELKRELKLERCKRLAAEVKTKRTKEATSEKQCERNNPCCASSTSSICTSSQSEKNVPHSSASENCVEVKRYKLLKKKFEDSLKETRGVLRSMG